MAESGSFPLLVEGSWGPYPPKNLSTKLQMYFQSSKRSGGGECEVRQDPGSPSRFLVLFHPEDVRQRVLERKNHELVLPGKGTFKLTLQLPTAPDKVHDVVEEKTLTEESKVKDVTKPEAQESYYTEVSLNEGSEEMEDTPKECENIPALVAFENLRANVTDTMLILLVENISGLPNDDFDVEVIPDFDVAVVTFKKHIDIVKFVEECAQHHLTKQLQLSPRLLEVTKTICVENLPPGADEYSLQLFFENPFHGGGRVASVKCFPKESSALIEFFDSKVLDSIMAKKLDFNKMPLSVFPYYASLGTALYGKEKPVIKLPAPFEESLDLPLWKFLQKKNQLIDEINEEMSHCHCELTWSQLSGKVTIRPAATLVNQGRPRETIPSSVSQTQWVSLDKAWPMICENGKGIEVRSLGFYFYLCHILGNLRFTSCPNTEQLEHRVCRGLESKGPSVPNSNEEMWGGKWKVDLRMFQVPGITWGQFLEVAGLFIVITKMHINHGLSLRAGEDILSGLTERVVSLDTARLFFAPLFENIPKRKQTSQTMEVQSSLNVLFRDQDQSPKLSAHTSLVLIIFKYNTVGNALYDTKKSIFKYPSCVPRNMIKGNIVETVDYITALAHSHSTAILREAENCLTVTISHPPFCSSLFKLLLGLKVSFSDHYKNHSWWLSLLHYFKNIKNKFACHFNNKINEQNSLFPGIASMATVSAMHWSSVTQTGPLWKSFGHTPSLSSLISNLKQLPCLLMVFGESSWLGPRAGRWAFCSPLVLLHSQSGFHQFAAEALYQIRFLCSQHPVLMFMLFPFSLCLPQPVLLLRAYGIFTSYLRGLLLDPSNLKIFAFLFKTDVIVNSVSSDLALDRGPLSNALLVKAGPELQKELDAAAQGRAVRVGTVLQTSGCNLHCRHVLHVVAPEWRSNNTSSQKVMEDIIRECLEITESLSLKSITFPAIGTGNLGFPKTVFAELIISEVFKFSSKNQPTTLQEVHFLLRWSDDENIQAFTDEFAKRGNGNLTGDKTPKAGNTQGIFGTVSSPISGVHEMMIGPIVYQVATGDITTEDSDVIVNSTSNTFNLKAGVSKAILETAGQNVELECSQQVQQGKHDYIITGGGSLKCKNIIHVGGGNDVKKSVSCVLQECEKRNYSSISLPAIGTGSAKQDPDKVAEAILDAIEDFIQKGAAQSVKKVKVVIFQPQMLNAFYASMKKREGSQAAPQQSMFSRLSSLLGFSRQSPKKKTPLVLEVKTESAVFQVCGENTNCVESTLRWIQDLIEKEQLPYISEDECIRDFDEKEFQKLNELQKKLDITISLDHKKPLIKVVGIYRDVIQARDEIEKMIKRVRLDKEQESRADCISEFIEWQYNDNDTFHRFDKMTNLQLEDAKRAKRQTIVVTIKNKSCTVNFDTYTATDASGDTFSIQRLTKSEVEIPAHWSDMKQKNLCVVELQPTHPEYVNVASKFNQTCSNFKIEKIERIQNPDLWNSYQAKKKVMDAKNGQTINEKQLFHGTEATSVPQVNGNGFNRSYAGKNAVAYGKGTYFAVNASYSANDAYSRPDANGKKYMYYVRVLTGVYTVGNHTLIVPPSKNSQNPTDLYDTVTDNTQNPTLFVVFYDYQAYPEYLITFRR
uniref:Poly [ADP-ribose] polymerase n=1 Tax=Otolemur garnettii TaxID=30611 RepID=H0X6Y7_OTOGA